MEITDNELRERLINLGFHPPPITSTSRTILLKKLKALETNSTMESVIDSNISQETKDEHVSASAGQHTMTDSVPHRLKRVEFFPENIGKYSRGYKRRKDFWDRAGTKWTYIILFFCATINFFIFKFIGDWSDRRYRSAHLTDAVYPNCKDGGLVGISCVPDAEFKFTETNLDIIRWALHDATVTERCSGDSVKSDHVSVGAYPVFKDDYVENLLAKELAIEESDAKMLLKNVKVIFKANPGFDVKVLNEGLMYRNPRLLRSCGYTSQNTIMYTYAVYMLTSFAVVWFMFKTHRWVCRLPDQNDEIRKLLIKDIHDILKQNQKITGDDFVSANKVRKWFSNVNVESKLLDNVGSYLKEYDANISFEQRILQGEKCDVFCLKK